MLFLFVSYEERRALESATGELSDYLEARIVYYRQ